MVKKINLVLKVENLPKDLAYTMAIDVFVAFGRVDRIKAWQASTLFICFENSESAALAQSKTNNLDGSITNDAAGCAAIIGKSEYSAKL